MSSNLPEVSKFGMHNMHAMFSRSIWVPPSKVFQSKNLSEERATVLSFHLFHLVRDWPHLLQVSPSMLLFVALAASTTRGWMKTAEGLEVY